MKKLHATILLIVIVVFLISFSLGYLTGNISLSGTSNKSMLNGVSDKEMLSCLNTALYLLRAHANISSNDLNLQDFRCSTQGSYTQLELRAIFYESGKDYETGRPIDNDQSPLYYHVITGGVRSSGADDYLEECLLIKELPIISRVYKGPASFVNVSTARCDWVANFP